MIMVFPNWLRLIAQDYRAAVAKYLNDIILTDQQSTGDLIEVGISAVTKLFESFNLTTHYSEPLTDAQTARLPEVLKLVPDDKRAAYEQMLRACLTH